MTMLSPRIKVAVVRGGPSSEYNSSLKSGAHVLSLLRELPDHYEPLDLFISRDGQWHLGGVEHEPHDALKHVDVVFNAMHGAYGEDGRVQQLLEAMNVPYTGSRVLSSALAMNKDMAKWIYQKHSLLTPRHEVVKNDIDHDHLVYIFRNYLHPVIVKSATGGSSVGNRLAHTFQELEESIRQALEHSKKAIIEEFIRGREATCGVVEHGRGERLYSFLPIGGATSTESQEITRMAKVAHDALGLRHYSSSDFVITPKGKIYILETDSLPIFYEESPLHQSLQATGWHPREFVHHCVQLALNKIS